MSLAPAHHLVISASAGSGKTYRLTSRYLEMIADGVPPMTIWATTFTRKAAGEILDRVLQRLTEAASSADKTRLLAAAINRPTVTREDCARWLRGLLAELHRVRIGTIDSLFLGLAGAFSMELGLPTGWSIADEADAAAGLEDALDETLTGDAQHVEGLVRLYERISPHRAQRGVRSDLLKKVGDLYSAFLRVPAPGWLIRVPNQPKIALHDTIERALGTKLTDKRAVKTVGQDMQRAAAGQWGEFIENGLACRVLHGETTYYGKPVPDELIECYRRLNEFAAWSLQGTVATEMAAVREFLEAFHKCHQANKDSGRGIRFDDVTRALGRRLADLESGLEYRADGAAGHLLLDEFQDTSTLQWQALEPLARMVMKAGGSVFAVGDAKQAIYGWRGGCVELFDRLPAFLCGITAEEMDHSRRSAPIVIECVNRVFSNLTNALADETVTSAAVNWRGRFRPHTTERADLTGFVHVETGPKQEDDEKTDGQRERHYAWVAGRVAEIYGRHPTATIGVLCRKNKAVARMVFELRKLGIPASQEGGNPLTDSAAIEGILSLLTLADHPGDSVAAYHLATEPLATMLRALGFNIDNPSQTARAVRTLLIDEGYGPPIARWASYLKTICPQSDCDRLDQLMQIADAYQRRATLRPSDFVAWVRQYKATAIVPSRVRVLTLHTAKGLEYDCVVLPELDVSLVDRDKSGFVVADPDPQTLPHGFVGRWVNKALRAVANPLAVEQTDLAQQRMIEESLSLLYVALTRPRQGLYVYPPGPQKRDRKFGWDAVVLSALCPNQPVGVKDRVENTVLFTAGDADWQPPRPPDTAVPAAKVGSIAFAPSAASRWSHERISPSHVLEAHGRVPASSLFLEPNTASRRTGDLHHAWFAATEWLDDGGPSDDNLLLIARRLGMDAIEARPQIRKFRESLHQPAIRKLLSKSAYPEIVRLERERAFAVRDGDSLLSGRIDRLVWFRDGSGALAADVIDFKSDDIPLAAVAVRIDQYKPQLDAYARAVARLGGKIGPRITTIAAFTTIGHVERWSSAIPES